MRNAPCPVQTCSIRDHHGESNSWTWPYQGPAVASEIAAPGADLRLPPAAGDVPHLWVLSVGEFHRPVGGLQARVEVADLAGQPVELLLKFRDIHRGAELH